MPTFFDLLKYAKTGIAAPDMTAYDKLKAMAMCGGGLSPYTIIGQPPISFLSDRTPLTSVTIKGNGQQSGTPTPDAPIMPDFCGVRTGNLIDKTRFTGVSATIEQVDNGIRVITENGGYAARIIIDVQENTDYTLSYIWKSISGAASNVTTVFAGTGSSTEIARFLNNTGGTFNTGSNTKINIWFYAAFNVKATVEYTNIMLNLGSTPLPYEPYGYKIPLTCAGQTTPLYLGEVSTTRRIKKLVLTGEKIFSAPYGNSVFYVSSSGIGIAAHIVYEILCTHFTRSETNFVTQMADKKVLLSSTSLYIRMDAAATVSDFKAYLAAQYAAGTPVTIWYVLATPETAIVNEPLMKIGDYADTLTTSTPIPTAKGSNELTVDTTVQPSEISITGNIKPTT